MNANRAFSGKERRNMLKDQVDRQYLLHILEDFLNTPSPSGYCTEIMQKAEKEARRLGYDFQWTNKGGGIITLPGQQASGGSLGITAHVDTLGAMVRSIKETGTLRMTPIGGYMMSTVEGEYCRIHTRCGNIYAGTVLTTQPSVHVYSEAREQKREEANMEIRIDEPVKTRQDVEALGIRTGDFISFDPRVTLLDNGYIKSRHLDDKAGVAAVFGMMEMLKREGRVPSRTVKVILSIQEEVGHGAAYVPNDIQELIAVDMGAIGDDLNGSEQAVSICAKDSSGPYDYRIVSRMIELSDREQLTYAVDIFPHYGSDASAALRGGGNICAGLVGPGVHASHGMERTHIDSIIQTAVLLAAYVTEQF